MASGWKPASEKRVFGEKMNLCRLCRWPLQGVPSIAQDPVRPCAVQQPDGLASGLPSARRWSGDRATNRPNRREVRSIPVLARKLARWSPLGRGVSPLKPGCPRLSDTDYPRTVPF